MNIYVAYPSERLNLTETFIKGAHGIQGVIKFRKMQSAKYVKGLVVLFKEKFEREAKKEIIKTNNPHLF